MTITALIAISIATAYFGTTAIYKLVERHKE